MANLTEKQTSFVVSLFYFCNGISRIFWGFSNDYVDFKKLYAIMNVAEIIIGLTMYWLKENFAIFVLYEIMTAAICGGNYTLYPPLISKLYGVKRSPKIYGFIFTGFGIGGVTGAFVCRYLLKDEMDFEIMLIIGAVLAAISLVINLTSEYKPYVKKTHSPLTIN